MGALGDDRVILEFRNLARLFVISISAAACLAEAGATPQQEKQAESREIKGWGSWNFGMSFEDALAAVPNVPWNSVSIKRCLDEIAIKGCLVSIYNDHGSIPLQSGIPFSPQLAFNKLGKIDSVVLDYERSGLSSTKCLDLFERTLDRLVIETGSMHSPVVDSESEWIIENIMATCFPAP